MGQILSVWSDKKQLAIMFFVAVAYCTLLIPLKPLPIIEGYSEFRPANFIPPLAGVLFGPAGAWGAAFGNLGADFFGTLSLGSIFGFIGNFLFAYVAYKIWNLAIAKAKEQLEVIDIGYFLIAGLVSSTVCALTIGLGVFILGLKPLLDSLFLSMFITLNNFFPTAILGSLFLWALYPRLKKAGYVFADK